MDWTVSGIFKKHGQYFDEIKYSNEVFLKYKALQVRLTLYLSSVFILYPTVGHNYH